MRTALSPLVLALVAMLAAAGATPAAQWIVAQDGSGSFRTIQGAIDASAYGDVVYVSPGVYDEHVVLKDGVRILGAGALSTHVRHAYGFDEVVEISHMGEGSLERVTIERLASVLPGPAVRVDSAAARLVDCTVTGGQGAGVEVIGSVSSLRLENVTVADNVGHGITVRDGARATLVDSRIERNSGSGLVVSAQSRVEAERTTIADNGRSGIALEDDAQLDLRASTVRDQSDWGLLALAAADVRLDDVWFRDNAAGGLEIAGTSDVTAIRLGVRGGALGISVSASATLHIAGGQIEDTVGDGVSVSGQAALTAARLEVSRAGRHGVVLASAAASTIERSTVHDCGDDGILISAGRHTVRESVIVTNRGIGIRVGSGSVPSPGADLAYNNVWGNGEDYAGTTRPASDLAEPPSLIVARGELAYLPDSPCLDAGATWGAIGSAVSVEDRGMLAIELSPRIDGWLDATWAARIRASGLPVDLDTLGLSCRWEGGLASLDLDAALLGAWGLCLTARAESQARWEAPEGPDFAAMASGAEARWSDGRAWASAWLRAEAEGAGLYGAGRASIAWPASSWSAELTAGLGERFPIRITVGLTDLVLSSIEAALALRVPIESGVLSLAAAGSLLPTWEASAEAAWQTGDEVWRGHVDFRPIDDAVRVLVSIGNSAARVEGRTRIVSGVPTDGEVSLALGGSSLEVRAALSLDSEGARVRLGMSFALVQMRPSPEDNEPPIPAFRTTPPDPEVGKPIRFLADETRDPDGQVREMWWDLGDGEAAEGRAVDHAYARPGTYDVVLTVSDDDGATASLTQSIQIWPADTAPRAAFTAVPVTESGIRLPRPLRAGDRIRLDAAESSDLDGSITEYAWDVGADGAFDVTSPEPVTVVGPLPTGSLPITLRVLDDSGRSDAVMQVVVVDKSEPPRAQFSFSPPTPAVRDPVYFTDRSTDTDGAVTGWVWDFGDGVTSHEAKPMHRYERVGHYTVTLRVADDDGLSATAKETLVVAAVPEIVDIGAVWAVLIGISDYAEVKDLQYATADAVAMARWLLTAGVEGDHVRLLLDSAGPQPQLGGLEARRATLVNVREALGWLRRVAKPDDLVLIHFSGHGFQGADDDGDEKDGVDEFFVLWDTLNAAKEDTALRDDEFGAALDRIESQHVVVFFDGCYSGGLSRSLPSSARPAIGQQDLFSDFLVEGRLVFSASSESQDAFESDELMHGVFTYYLLDGLGGSADANADGRVTAWELYEHVARRVPERVKTDHNANQSPQLLGEGDVRVLLAETARPPTANFSYQPSLPYAGGLVAFSSQSTSSRRLIAWRWTFGDGANSDDPAPKHTYAKPGEYSVELRVVQDDGREGVARQVLQIAPPGEVLSVDASTGLIVLSLGSDHGVEVGDRFEAHSEGTPTIEIEVTELIENRTSAGRVVTGLLPEQGGMLSPVFPSREKDATLRFDEHVGIP